MDEGHCGLPIDDLVPRAERLLEVHMRQELFGWRLVSLNAVSSNRTSSSASR